MRNFGGTQYAQFAHGLKPHVLAFGSDIAPWTTLFVGAVDDLVVNVGDIRDQPHL